MIKSKQLKKADLEFFSLLTPVHRGYTLNGVVSKCWEFGGSVFSNGYGRLHRVVNAKRVSRAHRYAYMLVHGSIADGLSILHHCDNRLCCNPNHLYEGDQVQNMDDMTSRNRQAKGSKHGNSVLVEDDVAFVRLLLDQGFTYMTIAEMFGMSKSSVARLASAANWKHVVAMQATEKAVRTYLKARTRLNVPSIRNAGSSSDSKHTTVRAIRAFIEVAGQVKTAKALNSTRKKLRMLLTADDSTEVEVMLSTGDFRMFKGDNTLGPGDIIRLIRSTTL